MGFKNGSETNPDGFGVFYAHYPMEPPHTKPSAI